MGSSTTTNGSKRQEPAKRKVLVIGGTLFIGRALVKELVRAGHDVSVLHRKNRHSLGKKVANITADRNNPEAVKRALAGKKFEVVYDNVYDWEHGTTTTQVEATARACGSNLHRYIFMSSVGAYGDGLNHHEGDALAPDDHPDPSYHDITRTRYHDVRQVKYRDVTRTHYVRHINRIVTVTRVQPVVRVHTVTLVHHQVVARLHTRVIPRVHVAVIPRVHTRTVVLRQNQYVSQTRMLPTRTAMAGSRTVMAGTRTSRMASNGKLKLYNMAKSPKSGQ